MSIIPGKPKLTLHFFTATFVALLCVAVLPFVFGNIDIANLFSNTNAQQSSIDTFIIVYNKIPRILTALLVGSCLAVSGVLFQTVLRNPLAEPYILGISAGAALGKIVFQNFVATQIQFNHFTYSIAAISFCLVGSFIPGCFVFYFFRQKRQISPVGILLAGLMLNTLLMSVIMLIQHLSEAISVKQMQIWWFGSVDVLGYQRILIVAPIVLAACCYSIFQSPVLNILSLDSDSAKQLGADPQYYTPRLLFVASLLAAIAVSLAGPIAFVGLIVPHFLRLMFGADNRKLVLLSIPYGALFLIVSDFIGSNACKPIASLTNSSVVMEIPVGIITSFIGAPVFLFLLLMPKNCTYYKQ